MARIAHGLAVARRTSNAAVRAEGQRLLIADEGQFEGVMTIGGDEHMWRHTRRRDEYAIVIIATSVRQGTGPSRLRDMV